jgi:hypothetical protein
LEGEVAEVRHLQLAHPVDVRALSDEDFRGRVASQARLGRTASGRRTAFWQTVGVGALDRSPGETERRVLEEEVVGFYDPRAKSLFVRASTGDQGQIVPRHPGTQSVLVHEIVHALQDQHFDLKYAQSLDEDEGLAYQALAEGDAILTSNGVGALEKGVFAQWRSRISDRTRALSPEAMLGKGGVWTEELRRAPALLRRRLLFPYVEGTAFVLELYRAGGFDLLDKAFARPPRSTEQVLHVQKYLAGEDPIPVDWPLPPVGWQVVVDGRMGELQTGVVLAQCVPSRDAEVAASGWGGDAWAIVVDSDRQTAMLWGTVWDDEASAIRFERAAKARALCTSAAPLFADVGRAVAVLRDGKRVAYVQGLPEPIREVALHALLSLPFDPPPAQPPFGRN